MEQKIIKLHDFFGSLTFLFFYNLYYSLLWKYLYEISLIKATVSKLKEILDDRKDDKNINSLNFQETQKLEQHSKILNNVSNDFSFELNNNNNDKIRNDNYDDNHNFFLNEKMSNNTNFHSGTTDLEAGLCNKLIAYERIKIRKIQGKIEFKNVSFSYSKQNKTLVLNKLSFIIMPGMKVGFVGVSGSGKSTIIQLLLRFYEPIEGEIYLDDRNIKDFDILTLRNYFSGVLQEPELLERSIYENIQYGRLNASKAEIEFVSGIAEVPMNLINQKANSIQNTSQISGGQKQRIALARGLLRERSIYVFDEATSALDAETEKKINVKLSSFFAKMHEKKTILIIAHR